MMLKRLALLGSVMLLTSGCSTAYYGALEQIGIHKREILVDRVQDARESQVEAKEQFMTALEKFRTVVNFDGGELEAVYEDLASELERSESKASQVTEHIDDIEDVAGAMFKEWEQELDQYSSASLRSQSEQQLRDTQRRYDGMLNAMRRAEAKMEPALGKGREKGRGRKETREAEAIASLQGEVAVIEADVASLMADLERAIAAADDFMQSTGI